MLGCSRRWNTPCATILKLNALICRAACFHPKTNTFSSIDLALLLSLTISLCSYLSLFLFLGNCALANNACDSGTMRQSNLCVRPVEPLLIYVRVNATPPTSTQFRSFHLGGSKLV